MFRRSRPLRAWDIHSNSPCAPIVVGLRRLAKFLHQRVNVVADVIGPGFCVLYHGIAVATGLALAPRLQEAIEEPFRLGREAFDLVRNAAARIGASLWGEEHAQSEPNGPPGQCTTHPNSSRAFP